MRLTSSLKEQVPGLVEEYNAKIEKRRFERNNDLEEIQDDERYSEEFIKTDSEKIRQEYDSLLKIAESNHRADIHNRVAQMESEEESII